jgi:hypothetical protein
MAKLSPQQRAPLRVCMSCEWIYRGSNEPCPKCTWPSYGARFVYGDKCYTYLKTQKPWKDKKMAAYFYELDEEIKQSK